MLMPGSHHWISQFNWWGTWPDKAPQEVLMYNKYGEALFPSILLTSQMGKWSTERLKCRPACENSTQIISNRGLPRWLSGTDSTRSVGDAGDMGSIPGSGRSPGGENGNPLQYSCLESPMDRGALQATVYRVAKSCLSEWVIVAQSCPTLCDPMDCHPPGSLVHGILQARIQEWVSICFSRTQLSTWTVSNRGDWDPAVCYPDNRLRDFFSWAISGLNSYFEVGVGPR